MIYYVLNKIIIQIKKTYIKLAYLIWLSCLDEISVQAQLSFKKGTIFTFLLVIVVITI